MRISNFTPCPIFSGETKKVKITKPAVHYTVARVDDTVMFEHPYLSSSVKVADNIEFQSAKAINEARQFAKEYLKINSY